MSNETAIHNDQPASERSCPDPTGSVKVPRRLLENLIDNTRQLRAENHWWKDEPRMDYRANYAQLCAEINMGDEILSQNK